jgi:hypothetical protein
MAKKKRNNTLFLYIKEHVGELLGGHLKNYLIALRMELDIFMWVASYLRYEGLILDSRIKGGRKVGVLPVHALT